MSSINKKSSSSWRLAKTISYVALGILIGALLFQNVDSIIEELLPISFGIYIGGFIVLALGIFLLPMIFNFLIKRYR